MEMNFTALKEQAIKIQTKGTTLEKKTYILFLDNIVLENYRFETNISTRHLPVT
jgi:hypothetical protein